MAGHAAAQQSGDFTYTNTGGVATITRYTGAGGAVTIPDTIAGLPVRRIGDSAFRAQSAVTSVSIPDNFTIIEKNAFRDCTGLIGVTFRGSLAILGEEAFKGCIRLTGLTIPDSVTTIGPQAFRNCRGLTGLTLPSRLTSIQRSTFEGCTGLTSIDIPAGVVSIQLEAFHNCKELTSVTIPDSVTIIGGTAFSGCGSLTRVAVPGAVTIMGGSAFEECPALQEIVVAEDNPAIVSVDGVLFDKNQTTLLQYPGGKPGGYVIPASVTSIAGSAFRGCSGLTDVAIHDGVDSIGFEAFSKCPALLEISVSPDNPKYLGVDGVLFNKDKTTLLQYPGSKPGAYDVPLSVTSIGFDAFRGCHGLTRVTISSHVTTINGGGPFANCTALQEIIVSPHNLMFFSMDGVLFAKGSGGELMLAQYPTGKVGGYVIPDGVNTIGIRAFSHCAHLAGVTIPASVTRISSEAFEDCTALTHVTIPARVGSLGQDAFQSCSSLSSVVFMGNAPSLQSNSDPPFDFAAPGFTIYYLGTRSGFTSPDWYWHGYRTVALSPSGGPPAIVAVTATPGRFSLVIVGQAGRTYRLERRPDLATGTWSTAATAGPLAAAEVLELTDPEAPPGQAFYRVVAVGP